MSENLPIEEKSSNKTIGIERIMQMIPHRYPFLLVDKLINVIPDKSATGIKNVTYNEQFFTGHFPGRPVMPGVLIIEAMAQTSAILVVETLGKEAEGKLVYFMSIEDAKFRRPVGPGDRMYVHVEKLRSRANVWKFSCTAKVDENKVAEAVISAMILN